MAIDLLWIRVQFCTESCIRRYEVKPSEIMFGTCNSFQSATLVPRLSYEKIEKGCRQTYIGAESQRNAAQVLHCKV